MLGYLMAITSIALTLGAAGVGPESQGGTGGSSVTAAQDGSPSRKKPPRASRTGTGTLAPRSPTAAGQRRTGAQDPTRVVIEPRQAWVREGLATEKTLSAPTVPPTEPAPGTGASPRARSGTANDLTIFRNTVVATSAFQSVEPTAANDRNGIIATGNRYAVVSEDNGLTFSADTIDPYDGELYGGFCCDQVAYAVDREDYQLIFWLLQDYYDESAEQSALRLHTFKGRGDLLAGKPECSWTLEPKENFDLEKKMWFDFNQVSHTSKFLYVTTNIRDAEGEADWLDSPRVGGLIFRIPLDDLDDGNCSIGYRYWYEDGHPYISPVQNAGHTMYLAAHVNKLIEGDNLRIYSIADSSNELEHKDRDIENYESSEGHCVLPDGTDPCQDQHDGRMSGFHSGDTVGWLWNADQDKHFPTPHVRVAVFEVGSKKKILEHQIYSLSVAWQLPSVGVNRQRHLGVILYAMGGAPSRYPSAYAFIRTDPRNWSGIEVTRIADSTSSGAPDEGKGSWGHYGSVRAYHGCDETFLGSAYTSDGGVQKGRMVWFGRPGSGCPDLAMDSVALGKVGGSLTFGDALDVTTVVVNQGSGSSSTSTLGYYLSIDQALDDRDIPFGITRSTDALDPGESHRRAAKVRLPATGPVARNYYVLACADDPGEIDEVTSSNNCAASRRTLLVGTAPDLVMKSVTIGRAAVAGTYLSGDTLDVTTLINNEGSALASASFIGYYLSTDQVLDDSDVSFGTTRATNALDPDRSHRLKATINVPPTSSTARDFYLIACADDLKGIRELDEKNNCAVTSGTLTAATASPGDGMR